MAARISDAAANSLIAAISFGGVIGTCMAWIYMLTDRNVFNAFLDMGSNDNVYVGTDTDGTTLQLHREGTNTNGSTLPIATWFHLTLRLDTGDVYAYLNAVEDATEATPTTADLDHLIVGNNGFGDRSNARYAAVKAWSGSLSPADIEAEASQYLPARTSDILGFWPCDPGAAERLRSYAGGVDFTVNEGTITDEDGPPISWGAPSVVTEHVLVGGAPSTIPIFLRR